MKLPISLDTARRIAEQLGYYADRVRGREETLFRRCKGCGLNWARGDMEADRDEAGRIVGWFCLECL